MIFQEFQQLLDQNPVSVVRRVDGGMVIRPTHARAAGWEHMNVFVRRDTVTEPFGVGITVRQRPDSDYNFFRIKPANAVSVVVPEIRYQMGMGTEQVLQIAQTGLRMFGEWQRLAFEDRIRFNTRVYDFMGAPGDFEQNVERLGFHTNRDVDENLREMGLTTAMTLPFPEEQMKYMQRVLTLPSVHVGT